MFRFALAMLLAILCHAAIAVPVGTQFSYQGRLQDGSAPANGLFDFEFRLFDEPFGGAAVGSILQLNDIPVENGVFSVELNFGAAPFAGQARWLAIGVREGTSTGAYDPLTPRQPLTVTPYALHALSGTPGPQGPQGASGVVQVVMQETFVNGIAGNNANWVFAGAFVTVTVQAGQRVSGSGVLALQHAASFPVQVRTGLCFSDNVAGATVTPFPTSFTIASGVEPGGAGNSMPVSGSRTFAVGGTYRVGACVRNTSSTILTNNDGAVNAWFMVSN